MLIKFLFITNLIISICSGLMIKFPAKSFKLTDELLTYTILASSCLTLFILCLLAGTQ